MDAKDFLDPEISRQDVTGMNAHLTSFSSELSDTKKQLAIITRKYNALIRDVMIWNSARSTIQSDC